MKTRMFLVLTALLYTGCAVGPNYRRPQIEAPPSFRAPEALPPQRGIAVGDLKWFEVFKDPELQNLVRMALERNYDLRDAVARVEQARAGEQRFGPHVTALRTPPPATRWPTRSCRASSG